MDAMSQVRIGMRVYDSAGEELGTVDDLKFGDAEAVTDEGQVAAGDGGLVGILARAVGGGTKLHPQAVAGLLRVGFIRIDRKGFLGGHAYAAADWIQAVEDDTVRLAVPSDRLHDG